MPKLEHKVGSNHIVVSSPDTDPAIGAKEIFLPTGMEWKHSDRTRYIPVHLIFDRLGKSS